MEDQTESIEFLNGVLLYSKFFPGGQTEELLKRNISYAYDIEESGMQSTIHFEMTIDTEDTFIMIIRQSYLADSYPEDVFEDDDIMLAMMDHFFDKTTITLKDAAGKAGITLADEVVNFDESTRTEVMEGLQEMFLGYDTEQAENEAGGFSFTPGIMTESLLMTTFVTMDLLLYGSKILDVDHNRAQMAEVFSLVNYNTVKFKGIRIQHEEKVEYGLRHWVVLVLSIECVCRILLSDVRDTIREELTESKMGDQYINDYLKHASDYLAKIRKSLEEDGAEITNFKKDYKWEEMIR